MERPRPDESARRREERETKERRRKASVRIGAAGIVLLFGSAIGVALSPGSASWLLAVMGLSIALLMGALLLVRRPLTDILRNPPAK